MGEQYNKDAAPNLYPSIAPESRFAAIASAIINKIGQGNPQMQNAYTARWTTGEGYSYVLHSYRALATRGFIAMPALNFMLEHYIDELPQNQPLARYQVTITHDMRPGPIRRYDASGKERPPGAESQLEINQKALAILTDSDPDTAADALRDVFEWRLRRLVGSYVLSDMAVEGSEAEEIDDYTADYVAQDFEQHTRAIEREERNRAKRRRAKKYPQPAYYEAVDEAITTRHYPTKSNKYGEVDVLEGAAIVAKELGGKWPYTVAPDQ